MDSPDPESAFGASPNTSTRLLGWREWIGLPDIGLPAIKAKLDTGARTSALHAFHIEEGSDAKGNRVVHFATRPIQRDDSLVIQCEAPLIDRRRITDSGGHRADRFVVSTTLSLGGIDRTIELTLTDRVDMLFRMLLGRTAMVPDIAVDAARSFTLGRLRPRELYKNHLSSSSSKESVR